MKAAAEVFERVGRALAGDAPDWRHHLADWLQVRRDTVRDWRIGPDGTTATGVG